MSHIHTEPGQHDITASAWIVREVDGEPRALVHMHRKSKVLMQIGGHIELDENPWQGIARELREEAGYDISELEILQPSAATHHIAGALEHPVPALSLTFESADRELSKHFHTDFCYVFVARHAPTYQPDETESTDLRWCTIDELKTLAAQGIVLQDVAQIYEVIVGEILPRYIRVSAAMYSQENLR